MPTWASSRTTSTSTRLNIRLVIICTACWWLTCDQLGATIRTLPALPAHKACCAWCLWLRIPQLVDAGSLTHVRLTPPGRLSECRRSLRACGLWATTSRRPPPRSCRVRPTQPVSTLLTQPNPRQAFLPMPFAAGSKHAVASYPPVHCCTLHTSGWTP